MIYLLAVMVAATRVRRPASLLAAVVAVASFDFFCVPPYYTFAVSNFRYVLTFAVMLVVGVVVSGLTQRVRAQADAAQDRERRTAALYEMTRELAARRSADSIAASAVRHVRGAGGRGRAGAGPAGRVQVLAGPSLDPREEAVARWVVEHGERAGVGTETLPGGTYRFVPLPGRGGVIGALGLALDREQLGAFSEELIHVLAANVALPLERAWYAEASEEARLVIETEATRSSLPASVSHDLRTPLASITGAASAALESPRLTEEERRSLLATIRDEGSRLGRLIGGLHQLRVPRLIRGSPVRKDVPGK